MKRILFIVILSVLALALLSPALAEVTPVGDWEGLNTEIIGVHGNKTIILASIITTVSTVGDAGTITIPETAVIRIVGDGGANKEIKRGDNHTTAFFNVEGTLILGEDGVATKGVTLDGGYLQNNPDSHANAPLIITTGSLTINDGVNIQNNNNENAGGGGVYVRPNGTFTMNGGSIIGNKGYNYGGGVDVTGDTYGTFTMNDGIISNNTSTNMGGGVSVFSGAFTMNGGSIIGNTAANNGGGVYVHYDNATFNVSGEVEVLGNEKGMAPNNIYLASGRTIEITGDGLIQGANLCVTTEAAPFDTAPVTITGSNDEDFSKYFHSDNTSYGVASIRSGDKQVVTLGVLADEVTLDQNGGAGGSDKFTPMMGAAIPGGVIMPTRSSYIFEGYFTSEDGGVMVISPSGDYMTGVAVYTDDYGNWKNNATAVTLHAHWAYNPPPPPPPSDPPVTIYDDEGKPITCDSLQDALDKIALGQPAERIVLYTDQNVSGNLTIPEDLTLDLNGKKLTCGTLIISEGTTVEIPEGQVLTIGENGDIEGLVVNGTLVVNGSLTLDGVTISGDGIILAQSGSVTLNGQSIVGKLELAALLTEVAGAKGMSIPKVIIGASFKASGVTGTLYLPAECYEVGFKVLDIEDGADKPNFKLANAPGKTWRIGPDGCLASDAEGVELIPKYLVVGKNTKTNLANLLPWNYEGMVTWESGDVTTLKIIKNGKKRLFKGVEAGSTALKATFANGETQTIPVTVVVKKEAVSSVGGPNAIKLKRGETRQLTPKVKPGKAIDKALFWHSSDEGVATVENGLITGVSTGTCRVVAVSTSGKRKVIKVTVTRKSAAIPEKRIVDEVTIG